jgi:maltooligosyltrehalose trehalohydrolase
MTTLLLLGPWTPLLFQGQEWCTSSPFPYFADHEAELARLVRKGRHQSMAQFPSLASRAIQERLPDPSARDTFEAAKLDWSRLSIEGIAQRSFALHRDLLQLRASITASSSTEAGTVLDGAALTDHCLALRWFSTRDRERLLLVNLGRDLHFLPAPEPLLAPPEAQRWILAFSSEDVRYGGDGQPDRPLDERGFMLPARSALLCLAAERQTP